MVHRLISALRDITMASFWRMAAFCSNNCIHKLFAEEVDARRAVREQLERAYGRLRAHYKAHPAKAEAFFLREGSRRAAKSDG
jgi:hypothetical protein